MDVLNILSDDLKEQLEEGRLRTMWDIHDQWGAPGTGLEPHVWNWETVSGSLRGIEEEAPLSELPQGIRRSLALTTPGSDITSETIAVFYQTVTPGETAGAHRHNVGAFRFVVEGSPEMYTVVEGERFPMEEGDLILTPNWTYHDHVNESDETAVWVDVLDWPFIGSALNTPIFENHSEFRQPVDKSDGYHNTEFGDLRPQAEYRASHRDAPPYRFAWTDAYDALRRAADGGQGDDPYNGTTLEYVNPQTGSAPTMSTVNLRLQLLRDNQRTDTHAHNTTEVYHVVKGSGKTQVGGTTLEWNEKDSFIVPPGEWHSHETVADESVLFAMTDRPIFDAFKVYDERRDEPEREVE